MTRRRAPSGTDWPRILALYDVLEGVSPGPMVTLNRAVALAMVDGPRAGLALLGTLDDDERMAHTHRLDAVRAHLLELSGDLPAAARGVPAGGAPDGQPAGAALPLAPRGTSRIGPSTRGQRRGNDGPGPVGGPNPGPPIATIGFGAYAASSWPRTAPPANAPLCTFT